MRRLNWRLQAVCKCKPTFWVTVLFHLLMQSFLSLPSKDSALPGCTCIPRCTALPRTTTSSRGWWHPPSSLSYFFLVFFSSISIPQRELFMALRSSTFVPVFNTFKALIREIYTCSTDYCCAILSNVDSIVTWDCACRLQSSVFSQRWKQQGRDFDFNI